MGNKQIESCGRCSVTTVVDAVEDEDDERQRERRDILGDGRIEIEERTLRSAVPHAVALGRLKRRLDRAATSLIYGSGRGDNG